MKFRKTSTLIAGSTLAVGAASGLMSPAAHAAQPTTTLKPAYSCSIDSYGAVEADWLRVHTRDSVSSPAPGEVPRNVLFHYCSSSETQAGGLDWVYGYGMNGSVKVTGWVDAEYLAHP